MSLLASSYKPFGSAVNETGNTLETEMTVFDRTESIDSQIARRLRGWEVLVNTFVDDAKNIRDAIRSSPIDLKGDKQMAVLLTYLNTVRRGQASLRYPLKMNSGELDHMRHKPSVVKTMVAMAWQGTAFAHRPQSLNHSRMFVFGKSL